MDKDYVSGIEKGLTVIECFSEARPKLTIADVSRLSGLSRAAARRCLLTLAQLEYAEYDGKYFRLTSKILRLGFSFLSSTDLPRVLQPALERLSENLHEACSASILDGNEVVYIARAGIKRVISVGLNVGARLPAYCTSMGRVLLAGLDPATARRKIEETERVKHTGRTVTDVDQLMEILADVRRLGYSLVDQELEEGLTALAAPVLDSSGTIVASLNVATQSQRMSPEGLLEMSLSKLLDTQRTVRPLLK